jgi:hypothetical protein
MKKHMNQSLFDVGAFTLAYIKLLGNEQHDNALPELYKTYRDDFKSDILWYPQMMGVAETIHQNFPPSQWGEFYKPASRYRGTLDDDMNPLSLWRKMTNGTAFSKSHPCPERRVEISIKNMGRCLLVVSLARVREMDART